ncbi:MAG: hypothetical protein ACKODG_07160, partial [Betaproteobacteria bacterium]
RARENDQQFDLFAADPAPEAADQPAAPVPEPALDQAFALRDRLIEIDPDALPPREALDQLYALRAMLDGR